VIETDYTSTRTGGDNRDEQARNQDWWERLPMTYEDWGAVNRSTTRERVIAKFLQSNPWLSRDYFSHFQGLRVLEIGCGAVPATCLFAEGGASVTAVDLTAAAVKLTADFTRSLGVVVKKMDAEHLEFAEASFDHVFS